jgi:hypothetical protein
MYGFGFEHYDALGRYRTTYNGLPVDARAALPSGDVARVRRAAA